MSVCYIFSGGVMTANDLKTFDIPSPDYVISADAGFIYANEFGYKTDCLIGDFDTLDLDKYSDSTINIKKFKSEKDDTDTMLAVRHAIDNDYDAIYIFGALGGRFDHTFANIQALNFIASKGKKGFILSENEFITVLYEGEYFFDKTPDFNFSVFALSEKVLGLNEYGFKYRLENAIIDNTFPIGVCNEFVDNKGVISFDKGRLLVVISKKQNLF